MTTTETPPQGSTVATDLQDERLQARHGVRGWAQSWVDRARGGELGNIPVIIGLVVIWGIMQALNPAFLSSQNLVNLTLECAAVGVIALGVVFMLLVGEIDLSVGSMSGFAAAILAVLYVGRGLPVLIAIIAAIGAGVLVGYLYSIMFNRFGVPSFVITLAGLLALLGAQLWVLGVNGSINLPYTSGLVYFAQLAFMPDWLSYALVLLAAAGLFLSGMQNRNRRLAADLSAPSLQSLIVRSVVLAVGLGIVVWYLNQSRGVGWMFVLFLGLVLFFNYMLTRTKWGRSIYAVGGNREAARRSGINVQGVYRWAFILCASLAALGGVLAAARLAAANQGSGTGDVNLNAIAAAVIGGTSLFGGRGSAFSALLGIVVIQSISSGLTLLNLDSSFRFMITGLVLLAAVALDSVARRSRASHGR